MKMLWSATRDHINCVPSLCVLGPFMCKQAENKKPLLSQLPSTQQIKWAVDQINFVLYAPNTSCFLHPWATTRAPSKNRKETGCQVSIDQRKCLALIVLGLPIDNHKLLARSSTVILQTRWDFNNNRKNKVRKYHPKIWNKNRKEIKEKNNKNKVR